MKPNKIFSLLGLAMKAGKVKSGEFAVEKAVKTGLAYMVIVSESASDNTKKKFGNMCLFYEVPIYYYGSKDELGACIGKEFRASLAVVDENFANAIEKEMGKIVEKNE
jgi:ribosomal protein L7Ae-like RNA K-turn-binding protein